MKWHYLLCDNGGVSDIWDCEMLVPIGSMFRHEYGIYQVCEYIDDEGNNVDRQFGLITQVLCERVKKV